MIKLLGNGLKLVLIAVWILACYYFCTGSGELEMIKLWVLCGIPFGMKKMCFLLFPRNLGIAGGVGVLAINAVIGGFIGGFVLVITIIKTVGATLLMPFMRRS